MRLPAALRRAAERLSRGVVLRRRLPASVGGATVFVSPDVALKYWRSSLVEADEGLFDLARELVEPGDVVWDIGASVGLFAFASAWCAGSSGHVVAVEPDRWVAGLLGRSGRGLPTGYAPVSVVSAAVADRVGTAQFAVAARGRAASHLERVSGSSQSGGERGVASVEVVTLDAMLERFPRPQVVKVDVEGGEDLVLQGGERLWRDARPIILCEVGAPEREQAWRRVCAAGYEILDARREPEARLPLDQPVWASLFVPLESPRLARLKGQSS